LLQLIKLAELISQLILGKSLNNSNIIHKKFYTLSWQIYQLVSLAGWPRFSLFFFRKSPIKIIVIHHRTMESTLGLLCTCSLSLHYPQLAFLTLTLSSHIQVEWFTNALPKLSDRLNVLSFYWTLKLPML
jgi:hypothetical protein